MFLKILSHCICLWVILIDSVFQRGKSYNPQVFLEKCKCFVRQNKMTKFVNDELEVFSSDSREGVSDEK